MRIAVGGIHIESCTFSPLLSIEKDFQILRGEKLLKNYGFISKFPDVELVPFVRARALPGGPIKREFYDKIKNELLDGLKEKGPWDGVFLHWHGAVNVQGMDDAEGDLLVAIRKIVGSKCLISANYDLHGNISRRVMENLDMLSAYRTAPHIDWYETIERAFTMLVDCLRKNIKPYKAFIPVPILLPGERTSTAWEPAASLYQMIPAIIKEEGIMDASILIGYVWADEPRASASVVAIGIDPKAAHNAAAKLAQAFWDLRHQFKCGMTAGSIDECIRWALESHEHPVLISDSGDNPTAGGTGDITCFLERLFALRVSDVVYASIADQDAVGICKKAGVSAKVELSLGGKSLPAHGRPLKITGTVLTLKTTPWVLFDTGPTGETNKMAVLQVEGIKIIITERRTPFLKIDSFKQLDIDPYQHKTVVVKIGYLEPELREMAAKSFLALSPGAVNQDIEGTPYRRIKRPMFPFDKDMDWKVPEDSLV